jgi:hypothetical protein
LKVRHMSPVVSVFVRLPETEYIPKIGGVKQGRGEETGGSLAC